MEIASIRHKALRHFAEMGVTTGLPGNLIERLRNMFAWLDAIDGPDEMLIPPDFGAHRLTGHRSGSWAMTVTKNWRLTLRVNDALEIEDIDLKDYP